MKIEGRVNEYTKNFEILYNHKWVILNDESWAFAKKEISNNFLIEIFNTADDIFKEKALNEFKRRTKSFNLMTLWSFFTNTQRSLGDVALNEIFERSEVLLLPHYKYK